jgi:quinol monooxygenase YgiN
MITRVVKMAFREEESEEFIELYNEKKEIIQAFDGCHAVILLRDHRNPSIFFTISKWEDIKALENYRSSDFFKKTWTKTKSLFSEKAEAWSLNPILNAADGPV